MKIITIVLMVMFLSGMVYAADFEVTTVTTKRVTPLRKVVTLTAGQRLADDPEILAMAQKTVPVGYKATIFVDIRVGKIEEVQ